MKRAIIFTLFFMFVAVVTTRAQIIEDALRLSHSGTLVSARSAGMGNAFVGLADDASALYWNPAGLGQLRMREFSIGLSNVGMSNDATMFGVTTNGSESGTTLTNLNLAIPFPVARGSFVVAAGYNRLLDYTGTMQIDVFNPQSSIQASLYNGDDEGLDFAWNLGLEDTLVLSYLDEGKPGWLAIPVANRVQQTIDQFEEGGLNQWSFGGSMEVAPNAMVGVSLNILSGNYRYQRSFIEKDINNVYQDVIVGIDNAPRTDFQQLELEEEWQQNLSGWNVRIGFLYNLNDKARFGVAVQTANMISVNEDYSKTGYSRFADASLSYDLTVDNNNYDITTAPVYSFGASWSPVDFATVSGDFELVDYSNLEFGETNNFNPTSLNRDIRNLFRATNNFRLGAEFNVPNTGLYLRGGFGYRYSPWEADKDKSEYDVKTISAGLGYEFENNFAIQVAYTMSNYQTFGFNYTDPDLDVPESAFLTEQKVDISRLMFGLTYRF
ncbi:MAG: outer membrane protein transport protein [Bacteroidetes bacterium]|nr:outer membrane protein transport protein [Bacteroidota bacterium]